METQSRPRMRSARWTALAIALGLVVLWLAIEVASAQQQTVSVEAYGFELECDTNALEGSTLECTLSNTGDAPAEWPTVAIVHLSSDSNRALVVGAPIDVAFGVLEGTPDTEEDVWWIGDVLVGYSRFHWSGEAAAASDSDENDSRTVNISIVDDTAWESEESFYVSLAPSGSRGAGFLYDNRAGISIPPSDAKSSDATLSSLEISAAGLADDGGLGVPLPRRALNVPYGTTDLTLTPSAVYKPAGIEVSTSSLGFSSKFPIPDSEETQAIPLAVGTTVIAVTVTAEDGISQQPYELVVNRARLTTGADVVVSSGAFTLTCPGTVAEGALLVCVVENASTSPADWPVVAFLHSSVDASRALISEDAIIPETSPEYSRDISLLDPQRPAVQNYNYGYGELFSGGSRSVYTTYGYEKFDWRGTAPAGARRTVRLRAISDQHDENDELFYAAIAPSAYTGLSELVDNRVPVVVEGTTGAGIILEIAPLPGAAMVRWSPIVSLNGSAVDGYDMRYIRSDTTDRSDANWTVLRSIWSESDAEFSYELSGLTSGLSYEVELRGRAGTTTGPWSGTQEVTPERVNEPPVFAETAPVQRSVAENTSAGIEFGLPVAANDPDGDTLVYSLTAGADLFEIGSASGQLSTRASLDHEADASHTVVVAVSDGLDAAGEPSVLVDASIDVSVSVSDVNEVAVLSGAAAVSVAENSSGSLGTYSAVDPDGDEVSWSLGGADGSLFEIDADGVLSFVSAPDFDAPGDADGDSVYEVRVQASDGLDAAGEASVSVDASIDVSVSVSDVNEVAVLSGAEAVEVPEGTSDAVETYSAIDPDGDEVSWSLGGADGSLFEIDAGGVLSFVSAPDFDAPGDADADNVYAVQVAVSDGLDAAGEPSVLVDASIDVSVSVSDVNEVAVLSGAAAVSVAENSSGSLGTYSAVDPDGDEVSWSLGGADGSLFEITSDGVLSFVSAPDFDAPGDADGDSVYAVRVQASDGLDAAGEASVSVDASIDVSVSVSDVNEVAVLSGAEAVEVPEGTSDAVETYSAIDPDGDEVSWSLGGADGSLFEIDAGGVLSFVSAPDFDAPGDADADNVYAVQVAVSDGLDAAGEPSVLVDASIDVSVSVSDVNEVAVLSGAAAVSVAENSSGSLGTYSAVDPDGDVVSWSLGGADGSLFEIDADGVLSFVSAPDFDAPGDADGDSVYAVRVQASDGLDAAGEASVSVDASIDVSVSVSDVNEVAVLSGAEAVEVPEGTSDAVETYSAIDPDGDEVSWSLGGADGSLFEIDAGGVLSFVSAPDFDAPGDADADNVYAVQVAVSDGLDAAGEPSVLVDASIDVSVSVSDVNEVAVLSGAAAVSVAENSSGSLGTYSAVDPDGDEVSWSLGGADGSLFEITSDGVLSFVSAPDFDAPGDADGDSVYAVRVQASDGLDAAGEASVSVDASIDVSVSVSDVNEVAVLSGAEAVEVPEGTSDAVETYSAIDPDGDEVSWSLGGADGSLFEIDAGGVLSFVSAPDFDAPGDADADNVYAVQVAVSDGLDAAGEPSVLVDASIDVSVSVSDVNEVAVLSGAAAVSVAENSSGSLGTYSAVDPDGDEVSWSLGGADGSLFEIDADGVLSFVSAPDFDAPGDADADNVYAVRVQASDGLDAAGEASVSVDASIDVSVSVSDVNEVAVLSGATAVEVPEGSSDAVETYSAVDPDGDEVSWSLGGADGSLFEIDAGGVLSFVSAPDFDAPGDADADNVYAVQVAVSDGLDAAGEPSVLVDASIDVSVSVSDVNEVAVLSGAAAVSVAENSSGSLGTYSAVDPDGDEVSWSLGGADGSLFEIDADGVLSFVSAPDFDAPGDADGDSVYEVRVQASDGLDAAGEASVSVDASIDVSVSVSDVNEVAVLSGAEAVEVPEGSSDAVETYSAVDPDGDEVSWSLGGADGSLFEIDAGGVLSFVSAPDFDAPGDADADNVYAVQVAVSDGLDAAGEPSVLVDASIDVSVSVSDVNEVAVLSGAAAVSVAENSSGSLGTYSAVDPDGDEVSWSLGGADGSLFEITSDGVLSFVSAPDFDAPGDADGDSVYEVRVQASDGLDAAGEASVSVDASIDVSVSVSDVNEVAVLSGATAVEVPEGSSDAVETYSAVDPDGDEVSWSLGGADGSLFEIDAGGVLSFVSAPDFDAPGDADADNVYAVQVAVSDGLDAAGEAGTAVDASIDVTVTVTSRPLTATLSHQNLPCGPNPVYCFFASTDYPSKIELELEFSEDLPADTDPKMLQEHGFEVVNTEILEVRSIDGRTDLWGVTIASLNANMTVTLPAHDSCDTDDAICSVHGQPLSNSTSLSIGYAGRPLTARFLSEPESHDGLLAFDVEIRFTKSIYVDPVVMRDQTFEITGGTIADARWLGTRRRWTLTVYPEPDTDVVISLPEETDCAREHAMCNGLLPLSHTPSVVISYDGTDTASALLTAEVSGVPEQYGHADGGAFSFEMRFNGASASDVGTLSASAFQVTGGTVTGLRQLVSASNVAWEVTVTPTHIGAVVDVVVPVPPACDAPGAICTANGTPLHKDVRFTVEPIQVLTAFMKYFITARPSTDDAYYIRLAFSLEPDVTADILRDSAFEVSGGTISRVIKVAYRTKFDWGLYVTPDGADDLVLVLRANRDCNDIGAICTTDGIQLSEDLRIEIPVSSYAQIFRQP